MLSTFRLIKIAVFLGGSMTIAAQDSRNMILAANRFGIVEVIDPSSLETVARIHLDFGSRNAGVTSIYASSDGSKLYLDGPIEGNPVGCCSLYSIDLATLQMKIAATIHGSGSRRAFVISDGMVYDAATLVRGGVPRQLGYDRLHLSPDRSWLFGVRSFDGPALDIFDVTQAQAVRHLALEGLAVNWLPAGIWSGNSFYLYAHNDHQLLGRVWTVLPETTQLGPGIAVDDFGILTGCPDSRSIALAASGNNLIIYEEFGFKVDRRSHCVGEVPGGAWMLDPERGYLTRQIAPELHFSTLISDPVTSELFGLSAEDPNWETPAKLVRINPVNGQIIKSRSLDSGWWRMTIAPIRPVPSGDIHPANPIAAK